MEQATYEAGKAIISADATISSADKRRILFLFRNGGRDSNGVAEEKVESIPRLLRRKEAASRLGISLRTLDFWCRQGILPKLRLPGRTRSCGVPERAVSALIVTGEVARGSR